jgi:hypothetical protein
MEKHDRNELRMEEISQTLFEYIIHKMSWEKKKTTTGLEYETAHSFLWEMKEPSGRISYWRQLKK